jgi:CheY-like chemotaxis protein
MANLLIIDDEQAICWGLAQLGKRLGHEVATASSAEQGLELATRQRPDAILLDVRLPGMDGLAALPRLKELVPAAPVIVMTAHGDLSTAVEAVRQGAFDYIAKPFDLARIERLIQRALAQPKAATPPSIDVAADGLSTATAGAAVGRLSQSMSPRSIRHWPKASCLAMSAGRSPAPISRGPASWWKPTAARCFSTKSPTSRWRCRSSCCGRWNMAKSCLSAPGGLCRRVFA